MKTHIKFLIYFFMVILFGSFILSVKDCTVKEKGGDHLLHEKMDGIYEEVVAIRKAIEAGKQIVKVSAYHPGSGGINSDGNPHKTALMKKPISGYTVAISDELFKLGWLGKKLYIDGIGVRQADDRMGKSVKGKQIDLCFPDLKSAKKFGIRENVLTVVLN